MSALVIAGRLPGLNEYVSACRSNPHAGASMKREAEAIIGWHIHEQHTQPVPGRVTVTFDWYEQNKRRDPDNIAAFGCKTILDSLVTLGILEGDGWSVVRDINHRFHVDKDFPRIEVWLEAV